MEHVVKRIAVIFKEQTGRDPTAEEVQALIANMNGDPDEAPSDEEEEEEEEEEAIKKEAVTTNDNVQTTSGVNAPADEVQALEAMSPEDMVLLLRKKLGEAFQQSQGRPATDDEIDQLLAQMSEDTELHDGLLRTGQQAEAVPETPADSKKRKFETGTGNAVENPSKLKKTSPASVTESVVEATNQ